MYKHLVRSTKPLLLDGKMTWMALGRPTGNFTTWMQQMQTGKTLGIDYFRFAYEDYAIRPTFFDNNTLEEVKEILLNLNI